MHLLPYIVSWMKVRSLNKSSHENLLIKFCTMKGCILPLEHFITRNKLPSDSVVGLSDKALVTP